MITGFTSPAVFFINTLIEEIQETEHIHIGKCCIKLEMYQKSHQNNANYFNIKTKISTMIKLFPLV